jgi:hypothetical protein
MNRYQFKSARLGFEAGRIIDDSTLKEGIIKTLLYLDAIEKLPDEVDPEKNVKPAVSSSNARRGKGASKGKRKQSGRSADKAD